MHYGTRVAAILNHPMLDYEAGYFLAPMQRGIRLTTGVEFAMRDAVATPVQLDRAEWLRESSFHYPIDLMKNVGLAHARAFPT